VASLTDTIHGEDFTGHRFVPYPAIFLPERLKITKKYDHRKGHNFSMTS